MSNQGRLISTTTYDEYDLFAQRITDSVGHGRFLHSARDAWDVENPDADPPRKYKSSRRDSDYKSYLYDEDDYIAMVQVSPSRARVYTYIASNSIETVDSYSSKIRNIYQPIDRDKAGIIPIKFWSLGSHGPTDTNRKVEVPEWEDIKNNYSADATEKLSHLMNGFKPSKGGQLLLWHGEPGTGKTFALRAMVNQWRKWCSAEYVVDPEKFFQSDASYMMSVLLKNSVGDYDEEDDVKLDRERWRLLIFEDTGELLASDARERSGQGLSRLLNVVDGLIGQGLRVLLLITTNEDVESLHPAVSRPGRAAIKVPFEPLDASQSVSWASRHGFDVDAGPDGLTLAELYAKMENFEEGGDPRARRPIGFSLDKSKN